MADSTSLSSSNDSDDEFLTLGDERASVDREALVRKKLLENFYGKSALENAAPDSTDDILSDDDDERGVRSSSQQGGTENLDSPDFDADAHTKRHIIGSSVHTLLETEEKLSLQVRTLDSTMQTLVYENYSRFIDATDAIRSIGVNVEANEDGLSRLSQSMEKIDQHSLAVEDALGLLRDQVAEKIRVKRLLTRLGTLLKLPQTLKDLIAAGRYQSATKSYLSALNILQRHSEGFESLKNIETECFAIIEDLKKDLHRKILRWSGRSDADDTIEVDSGKGKTFADIFECTGTLCLLQKERPDEESMDAAVPLTKEELQSLSLSSSMRILDRFLDTHMIDVQERRFETPFCVIDNALQNSMTNLQLPASEPKGMRLIPREVLDAILEVSTLFVKTFGMEASRAELMEFISESYYSFLVHVRAVLLEESSFQPEENEVEAQPDVDLNQEEVSGALSILVLIVGELASSLTNPDLDVPEAYASSLVEQVMELTESMVKRRVDQKFQRLRQSIIEDCLVPFIDRLAEEKDDLGRGEKSAIGTITQMGSSTLSDCLQLVDDTIRSTILANSAGSASSADLPILKEAVHTSTHRFALWLASALESLASGEMSTDPDKIIEMSLRESDDEKDRSSLEGKEGSESIVERSGESSVENKAVSDLLDKAHSTLLYSDDSELRPIVSSFLLGMAEICRLAETSVPENLNQSIASHLGGSKKKATSLFPSGESRDITTADEVQGIVSRFQTAYNRLIVLYATTRGAAMGDLLSLGGFGSGDVEPTAPRQCVVDALAIVKETSLACGRVFGSKGWFGPIPTIEEGSYTPYEASMKAKKSGLSLDVERMFKENVKIYPHPAQRLLLSRDNVLFILFKVAFGAFREHIRECTLTAPSLRQVYVDAEFLKLMVPHYIDESFTVDGSNACSSLTSLVRDIVVDAEERCLEEASDFDDVRLYARRLLLPFLAGIKNHPDASSFLFLEKVTT